MLRPSFSIGQQLLMSIGVSPASRKAGPDGGRHVLRQVATGTRFVADDLPIE